MREIEFGGEDGSRADVDYLIELARACYEAGGTRYSFPDTVGFFAPEGVDYYIPKLVAAFPDKPLVIHFHNDFGLGAYNTVRALHHGATIPTCTVNGIGERAGNAPLHTTVMILKELYGVTIPGFRYDMLWALRRKVEEMQRPARGRDASPSSATTSSATRPGIHTAGITIHPAIYQVIEPETRGRAAALPLRQALGGDGHRGGARSATRTSCRRQGVEVTPRLVQLLLRLVKEVREKKAIVSQHLDGVRELLRASRAPGPHRAGPPRLRARPRPGRRGRAPEPASPTREEQRLRADRGPILDIRVRWRAGQVALGLAGVLTLVALAAAARPRRSRPG